LKLPCAFLHPAFFDMETVQDAVEHRRQNEAGDGDEQEAGEQGVTSGEYFDAIGLQTIAQGAHAGENHRGVNKCIDQTHAAEIHIARHANGERHEDSKKAKQQVLPEPIEKPPHRNDGLLPVFKLQEMAHGRDACIAFS
jgi:hypothetical protein